MSIIPEDLKYSESHEWIKVVDGNTVLIGITDYAQSELGSVVFVELPEADSDLEKDEAFGAVESVKAASDLISPVSGKVLEINSELEDAPENINTDPYGAWMIKVELADVAELDNLLEKAGYEAICN